MFERNRIDRPSEVERITHPVEIELTDGNRLVGRVHSLQTRTLMEELNGTGAFVDFESLTGERALLGKARIVAVKSLSVPRGDHLSRSLRQIDAFDPHAVLGLTAGADRAAIKDAYHRKAKAYHPDRFTGVELPQEVADYLSAVTRRINVAYAALEGPRRSTAEPAAKAG